MLPGNEHTLTVAFDIEALGVTPGEDTSAKLAGHAGEWADAVMSVTTTAPEPAPPRQVDAVVVRLVRTVVVAEATVPLPEPREVFV